MPASFFAEKPGQKGLIAILSEEKSFIRCFFSHMRNSSKNRWWIFLVHASCLLKLYDLASLPFCVAFFASLN
jgi:hypothetical protein